MHRPKHDYAVGYSKPPKHTRYEQGRSGNLQGRPRGSKNLKTLLDQALDEKVTITENGRRRRISKLEAAFMQLADLAARGDLRATQTVLGLFSEIERHSVADSRESISFSAADRKVLQFILKLRIRKTGDSDEGP